MMRRWSQATSIECLPFDLPKTFLRSNTPPIKPTMPLEPTKAADAGRTGNPEFDARHTRVLHFPRLKQAFQIQTIVSTNSTIHIVHPRETTKRSNRPATSRPRIQSRAATEEMLLFVRWVAPGLTTSDVLSLR